MAATRIPVEPGVPAQSFTTTIAGRSYVFEFRWNGRDSAWYMNLRDSDIDETPIRMGIKIVLGTFLGNASSHPDFPPGAFIAYDTTNQGLDATLDDIGDRVEILHLTSGEIDPTVRS